MILHNNCFGGMCGCIFAMTMVIGLLLGVSTAKAQEGSLESRDFVSVTGGLESPEPFKSDARLEVDDPPADAQRDQPSTLGRLGTEAGWGLGGAVLGGIVGAGLGYGALFLMTRGYVPGLADVGLALGAWSGVAIGSPTGVYFGAVRSDAKAMPLLAYLGSFVAFGVGVGLTEAAFDTADMSVPEFVGLTSIGGGLAATVGAIAGYELTLMMGSGDSSHVSASLDTARSVHFGDVPAVRRLQIRLSF